MKSLITRLALIVSLSLSAGTASAVLIHGGTDATGGSSEYCWGVNTDNEEKDLFAGNTRFSIGSGNGGSNKFGWNWSVDASNGNVHQFGLGQFFAGWGGWVDIWNWFNWGSGGWWGNGWGWGWGGGHGGGSNGGSAGCQVECGPAEVPEPGTLALFGLGLLGLRAARNRRIAKA